MNIEVIKNPKHNEINIYKRFSDENWGEHVDSVDQINLNFFLKPNYIIVAKNGGEIMGLLEIFIKRKVKLDNITFSIGGIGDVVTVTKFRHQGVATEVLKKAVEIMKQENLDVSMLCTDINQLGKLYSKVGFTPLGRPYYFLDKNNTKQIEKEGMIMPVNSMDMYNKIINSKYEINVGPGNF